MGPDAYSTRGIRQGQRAWIMALNFAVLQPTLQVSFAVLITSLLTFIRPINFSLACLSSVFVLVLHILLVQNFHVGTQLLSAASLLGTVWSGIAAAGIVVSVSLQIPSRAGQIALLVVLASTGFALGCLVRVSARQFPLLFLQGTNLLMTFGMSIVLAFWAPSLQVMWSSYLVYMLLAFTAAGLASVLSGLLVLPSLATAEAMRNVITALNRSGQTSTMCISILLAPMHVLGPTSKPGDPMHPDHHQHQEQQQHQPLQLGQQASLLLEDALSPQSLSSIVEHASHPGQWGLLSFLAANSAAAAAAAATLQQADGQPGSSSATVAAAQQQTMASLPLLPSGTHFAPAAAASPPAPGVSAVGAAGQGPFNTSAASTAAPAGPGAAAGEDEEDWGDDHYEDESLTYALSTSEGNLVSADANVQLAWVQPLGSSSSRGSSSNSSGGGSGGSSGGGSRGFSVGEAAPVGHAAAAGSATVNAAVLKPHISEPATALFTNTTTSNQGRLVAPLSARAAPLVPQPLSSNSTSKAQHTSHHHHLHHHHPVAALSPGSREGAGGVKGAASDLQRHPLVRLQRGVDQIRPLLQAAKQLQGAVVVEQAWWVGLLVRQRARQAVDAGAWQQLVEALESLLHRVAALESMLEGGHDYSSLAQLTSYQSLAATCGAVFAQSAALCGVISRHLSVKLQQTEQQGDLLLGLQQLLAAACSSSRSTAAAARSRSSIRGAASVAPAGALPSTEPAPATLPSRSNSLHPQHLGKAHQANSTSTAPAVQSKSSFLRNPQATVNGKYSSTSSAPCTSNTSRSKSSTDTTIDSSSVPEGPSPVPFLCSSSCFDWAAAKQQLVSVLEYETRQYYAALVQAAADRPFKLDPARSITSLMFLVMLSLGVIEACQKLQGAAQAVLACRGDGSALGHAATQPLLQQQQQGHDAPAPAPAAAAMSSSKAHTLHKQQQMVQPNGLDTSITHSDTAQGPRQLLTAAGLAPAGASSTARLVHGEVPLSTAAHRHATATATNRSSPSNSMITDASGSKSVAATSSRSKTRPASSSRPRVSGTRLLLRTFLMVDAGLRIWDALANQLPAACKSRAAFAAQLRDRRFQAGFKAWLASSIALVVIAAAYTQLGFLGRNGPSVFMFGFMSLVFTMRERVESSMEMVLFRVGATVVGACLGHLFMFNPATAYNPYILGAVNVTLCLLLVPFSLGQFRLVVVLGLLTFASVTLCQYAGCCGAVGSVTYLVGRILATGGGALFAMLLNRLLWPWRRNRWAMEELSKALDIAVTSARLMYDAEYTHLSTAAATTPATSPASIPGLSFRSGDAADGSPRTAAATEAAALGSGRQHLDGAVVIELPATAMQLMAVSASEGPASSPKHSQQPQPSASGRQRPASPAGAGAGAGAGASAALAGKSLEQLQQMLLGLLMPVQISIARDTWINWKKGALALTPSVPLMMLSVQQMLDALSALGITYKLLSTMQQQPQQHPGQHQPQTAGTTPFSSDGGGSGSDGGCGSSDGRSPSQCVQWQQELLLHELVEPIHSSFAQLLSQLGELAGLVGVHVRGPTEATKEALHIKIKELHDMRVCVSLQYVTLRNQRHRKMRQQLSALRHNHPQHPQYHHDHHAHSLHDPIPSAGILQQPPTSPPTAAASRHASSAAGLQAVAATPGFHTQPAAESGALLGSSASSGGQSWGGAGSVQQGCTALAEGEGWCIHQPGFQHQVLSTVQYMAFIHALRRFFDRALAVARCAADATF